MHAEFYGHDQLVTVRLDVGTEVRSRSIAFPAWHPGDQVRLAVDGPVNVLAPRALRHPPGLQEAPRPLRPGGRTCR